MWAPVTTFLPSPSLLYWCSQAAIALDPKNPNDQRPLNPNHLRHTLGGGMLFGYFPLCTRLLVGHEKHAISARDDYQFQIMHVAISLIVFGAHMNIFDIHDQSEDFFFFFFFEIAGQHQSTWGSWPPGKFFVK